MSISSCVTISLVPEARGGPFVFWDDLAAAAAGAAELGLRRGRGLPAVPDAVDPGRAAPAARRSRPEARGGRHRGRLGHAPADAAPTGRRPADARRREFIRAIIDLAGPFGASAIIGSMQGRWGDGVDRETALGYLAEALDDLGEHAGTVRRAADLRAAQPLRDEPGQHRRRRRRSCSQRCRPATCVLLADLFHMNIEEADIAGAAPRRRRGTSATSTSSIRTAGRPAAATSTSRRSSRRFARSATTATFRPRPCRIPIPTAAARQTIEQFREFFPR